MPSPFSLRDSQRLDGVHPDLIAKLSRIFVKMQAAGHQMFVVMGVRTVAQQQALYALGRTQPGRIVTMKNGTTNPSNHQPHADGYGHAVDCAFWGVSQPFDATLPWETYGEAVEAEGLTWGGRWTHPHDSPHAELSDATAAQDATVKAA